MRNVPISLTGARLGSLSTRTTHPIFIRQFQELLDAAGRVTLPVLSGKSSGE